ncbi:MAG: hypothetical protein FT714_14915 [Pantoea sp. Pent]|nr:hypothetical protein [Pantoea sp. Pent]
MLEEALTELDSFKEASEGLELEYLKQIDELEVSISELSNENIKIAAGNDRLKFGFKGSKSTADSEANDIDVDELISLISNRLSPEAVLNVIEILIPSNVVILRTAYSSARESLKFKHEHRLIFLLYKLCTSYLREYLENDDNTAKNILGDAYSANESETVEKSGVLSKIREFEYNGEKINMFQHVGIGTARTKSETIRVHFYIDKEKSKVVIGYCGEHLEVKST